jgi:succinyldiaminopimelate transaminase
LTGTFRRSLPDFPWDLLAPAKKRAAEHPGGIVDLSIGTPVDPVPAVVQAALAGASDAPGYPQTAGTPELRAAITAWVSRHCCPESGNSGDGFGVLPTIGSKELVAWLPTLLGLGAGDVVVIPSVCYPTYEVGVRLAGAEVVRSDDPAAEVDPARVRLVWVNSPGNPTGRVSSAAQLGTTIAWARSAGAVVVSDECYLTLGWDPAAPPVSALAVSALSGAGSEGVLAVHSLSKRSNLAGYRAGFVAGDPEIVDALLEVRKHSGLMVPSPVQAAMVAALSDEEHVGIQRARYGARREALAAAVTAAGFTIEHSEAGLYLWITDGTPCWEVVDRLAELGIVVAPGDFYGPAAARYVRMALTATDERVAEAVARLNQPA